MRFSLSCLAGVIAGLSLMTASAQSDPVSDPLSPDAALADLERLYAGLQTAEADLFAATPKRVFDAQYEALREKYDEPIALADLHRDFQQFAALAGHAHTRMEGRNPGWSAYLDAGGLVFPLSLSVENGEVLVAAAPEDSAVQPGDRIRALEGAPNPIWLAGLTRNISAETPELAYTQLAGGEPYYVWLEYGARDVFEVELERDGERLRLDLDAVPVDALSEMAELDTGFSLKGREARLLDEDIAYIRPGAFYNLDAATPEEAFLESAVEAYTAWIDEAFESFLEAGVTDVIVDLRDNPGGSNSFSDPLIAWFADEQFRFASDFQIRISPETIDANQRRMDAMGASEESMSAKLAALYEGAEPGEIVSFDLPFAEPRAGRRFEGRVHVLVNRYSYSNAVNVGAIIQDYGFGLIYGEATRDMATTYGAMEHFTLPNSGFLVGYPKALIIRPNGETRPHPLTPDVLLPAPSVRGPENVRLEALTERIKAGEAEEY